MNKKYLPSALIMYLNYFIHGIGCSILGQAVIKSALAAAWGVEAMAITAISAALGLGRLVALPFAGPLSDKLGRRISTAIGSLSYAIYLVGLAMAFNAGTNGGYQIAYACAVIGGIANSFLDTGIYPAVQEIIYKAPSVATMGIKFFISIAQMILPFVLGVTVSTTAAGLVSYNTLFYACGIAYVVLFAAIMISPLPDADQKAEGKKEGLIASLKHTHISLESIAMILIGFTCTGTFQLWLNCAQNFATTNAGWADPSIMQTWYSAGTLIALVVTAFLTRKIKDVRFILIYPVICLATLILVLMMPSQGMMIFGAFAMGWRRRTSADRNFRMQHDLPENQRYRYRSGYDRFFSLQLHHPDRSRFHDTVRCNGNEHRSDRCRRAPWSVRQPALLQNDGSCRSISFLLRHIAIQYFLYA